jgi:hypothetical protein
MKVVCQQPHFFPWLGYFELFEKSDIFVFLDTVQWTKQGRQHRTKIFSNGKPQWLTLPIISKDHRKKCIKEMKLDDQDWAKKHWHALEVAYGKSPYFHSQMEPLLRPFYEKVKNESFFIDVCQEALWLFWEHFEIKTELHWASDIGIHAGKSEDLVKICNHFGAKEYYSSLGSTRYVDLSVFRDAGVRVYWQHFRGYYDLEKPADLSILDWIANKDFGPIRSALKPKLHLHQEISADL